MRNDNRSKAREDLETAIWEAFAEALPPRDGEIVDCPGDYEADEIYRHTVGKTWPQLLEELKRLEGGDLYYFHSVYWFLTPVAFHYYLPAFLTISLDPVEADTVCEYLFYALAPKLDLITGNPLSEWFIAFAARVTPAQREILRRFILYVNDLCDELDIGNVTAHKTLRQFWFPEGFPREPREEDILWMSYREWL